MFLEDKFADVKLLHEDGKAFEVWWFYNSSVLAVSHCPSNYPSTIVHTMEVAQSKQEISKLLNEGWTLDRCSYKFSKLLTESLS